MTQTGLRGVLFDKDGTLFDFRATWDVWAHSLLRNLSEGRADRLKTLAQAAQYDLSARAFEPSSPIIACTNQEAAQILLPHLPDWSLDELEVYLAQAASTAPLAEATPLVPLLAELAARDMALGVMTNDTESTACAHLGQAGVLGLFDFVAGFDSGFGAKPAPDPLLAFAAAVGLQPAQVVMVGDSTHDLLAGRAAGMATVGVLTGTATRDVLAPYADEVLPDIGHLPGWIDAFPGVGPKARV